MVAERLSVPDPQQGTWPQDANPPADVCANADASCSSDSVTATSPRVCRGVDQFKAWQRSRPWLAMSTTGSVMCSICASVGSLGLFTNASQHDDNAFAMGTVQSGKNAHALLKKIDKHRHSKFHEKCQQIVNDRKKDTISENLKNVQTLFEEKEKDNIVTTEKIFRTAYECAQSQLSFKEHSRLVKLQEKNGLSCGNILYSDHACIDIVKHIASEMCNEIVQHIIQSQSTFAILIDESTSCSNDQSVIVYVRTLYNNEPCVYFLGLLPLGGATAEEILQTLTNFFTDKGLTHDILSKQLIAFCSDGASTMMGKYQGVASLLKGKFPKIQVFHCMAHRLELAVKNAVDDVNAVSQFSILVDSIYKVYSMSPKNQRQLDIIAQNTAVHLNKVQKGFDLRCVFSSFTAVKSLLRDYPALHSHFVQCATDNTRSSKERSKFSGLAGKMQSWFVVAECVLLKDTLRLLKQLSLFFQSDTSTVINACAHISVVREKLLALKENCGKTEQKFKALYEMTSKYKVVLLCKTNADERKFCQLKIQFCQALVCHQQFTISMSCSASLQHDRRSTVSSCP